MSVNARKPGARASCPPKLAKQASNLSLPFKLELRRNFLFAPVGAQGGQGCPRSRLHSIANCCKDWERGRRGDGETFEDAASISPSPRPSVSPSAFHSAFRIPQSLVPFAAGGTDLLL